MSCKKIRFLLDINLKAQWVNNTNFKLFFAQQKLILTFHLIAIKQTFFVEGFSFTGYSSDLRNFYFFFCR